MRATSGCQRGFNVVELTVMIVIIAILATFAVPKFFYSVERSKAAEAFNYLSSVHAAQERYHKLEGHFAARLEALRIELPALEYFATDGIVSGDPESGCDGWWMTLTRKDAPTGIAAYTVVFNQCGFDAGRSTISDHPDVDPMQARTAR